jgi:prevent-host-death family protein
MIGVNVTDVRSHLSALLTRIKKDGPVMITQKGKPVAMLVPPPTTKIRFIPAEFTGERIVSPRPARRRRG